MSTLNVKLSQTVVNKNHQLDDGSPAATLGDIFAQNVIVKKAVMDATYWINSLHQSGNKYTFKHDGGIQKVMTGSHNPHSMTAHATEIVTTVPQTLKETVRGSMNMTYDYDSIWDTGGTVTSYLAEVLVADPDFGRISSGFTGNLNYDSSYNLSGTLSSLTLTAQKHIKQVKIEGALNIGGNLNAIASGASPSMNGTVTHYNESYVDGSYIDFSGSLAANQNTSFSLATLADTNNWTLPDTLNIDLPKILYQDWVINTGTGNDTLTLKGGGGRLFANAGAHDDYVILLDNAPIVDGGSGTDTLEIRFSGGLNMLNVSNFENLVLGGKASINGTGNADDNTITGNDGKNTLDGGGGVDTLIGGKGDDVYIVADSLTTIIETAVGGKKDQILTSVSYILPDHIELLTLTGTDDIDGTGNALKNIVTGNSGSNTLDGGGGGDTLIGGVGDDVYIVRDAKDKITEKAAEGHDRIDTTVNKYSLAKLAEIEDLGFIGIGNAALTGNAKANSLQGGVGNDTLDGGKGADAMAGGDGDDIYFIDDVLDTVLEFDGEGYDKAFSSVSYALSDYIEELALTGKLHINGTGNAENNLLTGNAGNNILSGLDGNDILDGLGGNDRYIGGSGNDTFRLSTAPNAKSNVNTIEDFTTGEDSIEINTSAFKWKGATLGELLQDNFGSNDTGIAETTDQRLIYNNVTGQMFYDADGSGRGKAVLVAVFENAPDLQHTDITLY
ncbi:MAG: calcium-binding protein [Alphaproteobacteria bacterium]|nr:calcium-binding protein [Alphaproteobacteria bacterium]